LRIDLRRPVAIIKQTGPGEARKAVSAILAFGYRHMAGIECRQVVVPPPWAPSDWIGGRHQIGTVRGIRSVYPGGFVGIRRLQGEFTKLGQDRLLPQQRQVIALHLIAQGICSA